jgi:hypothetical protein
MLKRGHDGPPGNRAHVREWAFDEFAQYIGRRFQLLDHFISNIAQSTQVAVAQVGAHSLPVRGRVRPSADASTIGMVQSIASHDTAHST